MTTPHRAITEHDIHDDTAVTATDKRAVPTIDSADFGAVGLDVSPP